MYLPILLHHKLTSNKSVILKHTTISPGSFSSDPTGHEKGVLPSLCVDGLYNTSLHLSLLSGLYLKPTMQQQLQPSALMSLPIRNKHKIMPLSFTCSYIISSLEAIESPFFASCMKPMKTLSFSLFSDIHDVAGRVFKFFNSNIHQTIKNLANHDQVMEHYQGHPQLQYQY